jgi:glycosyltransferase involved in cell wall biosynthesis
MNIRSTTPAADDLLLPALGAGGLASVRHYCPGGAENGGGIGRLVGYVVEAATARGASHAITDTRGPRWSALHSPRYMASAVARMTAERASDPARIHHIHIAGRGSTWRKLVLAATARRLGCRHVLHLHDYDYAADVTRRPPRVQAAIRAMFAGADGVIVLGGRDRDFVTGGLGVDPGRVWVLHNCVPDPGPRESARPEVPQILFLGSLGTRKGVPELLAALAGERMRGLCWRAVLAGDGEVEAYGREVTRLGLGDRVRLTGWLPREATMDLRRGSDILVLPSHAEGLSMAVLEGLASSLAVVTTPVGAHAEVIRDGETGLFVPPGDVPALAEALARVVIDADLRGALAQRGRSLFTARYSIAAYMDLLERTYARLPARDGAARARTP